MRITRKSGCALLAVALPLGLVASCSAHEAYWRYQSWNNLSKAEVVASANWYIENRSRGKEACLYALICDDKTAKLELVKDIDEWDLDATKDLIWERKFDKVCTGRTAHLALRMLPEEEPFPAATDIAVWSFYLDRFTPYFGRLHGPYAFSEGNPEACTHEHVVTGKRDSASGPG